MKDHQNILTEIKSIGNLEEEIPQNLLDEELVGKDQLTHGNVSPSIDQLGMLESKVLEFKKIALKFKKEKDLHRAREALVMSKKVQEQVDRINSGLAISPEFSIPNMDAMQPMAPQIIQSPVNSNHSRKSSSKGSKHIPDSITQNSVTIKEYDDFNPLQEIEAKMESKDIFGHLGDLLNEQIKTCTNLSAYYFKSGKKDKALEFHKNKKAFLADLETLTALSQTPGAKAPVFTYLNVKYDVEVRFPELSPNELLLSLVKGYDINTFKGASNILLSYKIEGLEDNGGSGEISLSQQNNPGIFIL